MPENQKLFALLIDGDNPLSDFIPGILRTLGEYGELRISKVFHNKTTIERWEEIACEYSIEPIWVPNNTTHKNSVDIALVMDAMSLLYEHSEITNFCIVASDGDYTRLARLLKSRGKFVLGIGTKQTPKPFSNACTKFVYVEDWVSVPLPIEKSASFAAEVSLSAVEISDSEFLKLVLEAYKSVAKSGSVSQEEGWIQLRDIKEAMAALNPEFQSSDYYKYTRMLAEKMKTLAESEPGKIEIHERQDIKPVIHCIRTLEDREIDRFRMAYNRAADELKHKDKNGWVKLSNIGNALQAMYPDYQPLVYRDTKYSQLKKVVEQMRVDYPDILELNSDSQHPEMRLKK